MAQSPIGDRRSPVASESAALPQPTLAEVYEAEFDYVFRCLRALGVPADHTDDALQDVFLVVQDKLATFDGRCRLRTWLYAIALRVARRYRTRAARDLQRVSPEVDVDARADERDGSQRDLLKEARRALEAMDPQKREVFVLTQVEGLSAPELAEVLRVPVNTVYSRIRAAKADFQAQVDRLQRTPLRRQA